MIISNKLIISPTDSCYKRAKEFCENELTIKNPKFTQAERMGFWTGNIPRYIRLYATDSDNLILPFGCYQYFLDDGRFETYFAKNPPNEMQGNIKLYDYQEVAVNQLVKAKNGILIAPTGAGKTILAIELIHRLKKKHCGFARRKSFWNKQKERVKTSLKEILAL